MLKLSVGGEVLLVCPQQSYLPRALHCHIHITITVESKGIEDAHTFN